MEGSFGGEGILVSRVELRLGVWWGADFVGVSAAAAGHDGGSLWCRLKGRGGGGIEVRVSCLVLSCLVDFWEREKGFVVGQGALFALLCLTGCHRLDFI